MMSLADLHYAALQRQASYDQQDALAKEERRRVLTTQVEFGNNLRAELNYIAEIVGVPARESLHRDRLEWGCRLRGSSANYWLMVDIDESQSPPLVTVSASDFMRDVSAPLHLAFLALVGRRVATIASLSAYCRPSVEVSIDQLQSVADQLVIQAIDLPDSVASRAFKNGLLASPTPKLERLDFHQQLSSILEQVAAEQEENNQRKQAQQDAFAENLRQFQLQVIEPLAAGPGRQIRRTIDDFKAMYSLEAEVEEAVRDEGIYWHLYSQTSDSIRLLEMNISLRPTGNGLYDLNATGARVEIVCHHYKSWLSRGIHPMEMVFLLAQEIHQQLGDMPVNLSVRDTTVPTGQRFNPDQVARLYGLPAANRWDSSYTFGAN